MWSFVYSIAWSSRLGVALGLVFTHGRPRSLEAVRVVPDEVPVPHRVAARRRQHGALTGRDGDRFREAGEVVDDPRPQHDRTGAGRQPRGA